MESIDKITLVLDQKLKKINETPASFAFFVLLHDFVQYIESAPSFAVFFSVVKKGSRASELSTKYFVIKQVYQGIEDINIRTTSDLGHDRYVAIHELSSIKKGDLSENNSFWKRRELLRKVAGETHATLRNYLSGSESSS